MLYYATTERAYPNVRYINHESVGLGEHTAPLQVPTEPDNTFVVLTGAAGTPRPLLSSWAEC